ncbi:U3 small nucleolar RNA-associated protein 19 [Marchantia polymorpha subsp. ruderalis]
MRAKESKASKSAFLEETKQLGSDLLTSRSHVNNAPALLSTLSNAKHPSPPRAEALRSLQAFFVSLLRAGKLESGARSVEAAKDGEEPEAVYRMWVWSKYQEFRKTVFRMITEESASALQVEALNTWMDLVRDEKLGEFNNTLYYKLCEATVRCKGSTNDILQLLIKKYFKYCDVRYYTYANLETLISKRLRKNEKVDTAVSSDEDEEKRSGVRLHAFSRNAYELLSSLPTLSNDEQKSGDDVHELWTHPQDEDRNRESGGKRKNRASSSKTKQSKPTSPKKQKAAFSKAWLAFLRLALPLDTYKKVLGRLHRQVIPHMNNPILLSDFLTQSYDVGGLISVMALSSLFILITGHGLEYPDFYNKLYALLEPSIFVAKHRSRFFELLDSCLKSSHLPAYLAAAFAKRLGRLVLSAPPSGSIVVIALIHNILRRHPSVNCLVHRDSSQATTIAAVKDGANVEGITAEEKSDKAVDGKLGADPFRADESDTAKCDALQSSLWEIDTLRRHYCPAVSRFVESLETDLTVRAKTTEMSISDFSSTSYATIFNEEVGRRLKAVPLAFYHTVPSTLFAENCFEGWTFGDVDVTPMKAIEDTKTSNIVVNKETVDAEEDSDEDEDGDEEEGMNEEDDEEENKDSMDDLDSDRDSDDSAGSRSRSEQSDGEDWPGPLKRFRSG